MSQARTQAVFWNFVDITEWYDLLATTIKDHPLSIAVNDAPSNVWGGITLSPEQLGMRVL